MNKKIFWWDKAPQDEPLVGGYYFRAFDLIKFMKQIQEEEGEVVGLEFDGNNVNVIIKEYDA
tara:strand:- start:842 stop:1027 length:186 start_codon:yes stop_codon:yes gene_type:complete